MAWDTKTIIRDPAGAGLPQYYSALSDQYQVVQGENGAIYVKITSYADRMSSNLAVGAKTVVTTAAAMFAGSSRLANRYLMAVYNGSTNIVYWGASGVTTATGYPLLPGDSVVFRFNPNNATDIYFVSESNSSLRVVELA